MPELPEVETVVRELRPHLLGRRIGDVNVNWARTIAIPAEDVARFRAGVCGREIVGLGRRAKFVIMALDDGQHLLFHLRMSGRLVIAPHGQSQHLRVRFDLAGGGALYFYDQRKFGRVWLVDDPELVVGSMGPEPLAETLTLEQFRALFHRRRGMIKPLLLNQRFLAGLGNIYTDEALFRAGLHPQRRADTLSEAELERLHRAIQEVLDQALAHHGTTFDGIFVRPQGEEGRQQEGLLAYGQAGRPCVRCGTSIERIVVAGRGTHLCPRCQCLENGSSG